MHINILSPNIPDAHVFSKALGVLHVPSYARTTWRPPISSKRSQQPWFRYPLWAPCLSPAICGLQLRLFGLLFQSHILFFAVATVNGSSTRCGAQCGAQLEMLCEHDRDFEPVK